MKTERYQNAIFVKESLLLTLLKSHVFTEIVSLAGLSLSKYLPFFTTKCQHCFGPDCYWDVDSFLLSWSISKNKK